MFDPNSHDEHQQVQDRQPLDLLYYQLRRAVLSYTRTGSPFALGRARELLAEVRAGLDSTELLLAQSEEAGQSGGNLPQ